MSIKVKFSVKTARVKGVCFHSTKPWILASLHTGPVEIWDFNMKIKIMEFDVSKLPTRAATFHTQLPLFVTGSDDTLVRVWDYKQRRCLFELKGHVDYIRTAFFHKELPWILTSSDDQTMRIWNYQSRVCVNIITGHCHYVMCAQFHAQKNLIVSASLDSTIRIWDYTVLKKKLTETKNISSFIGIQIQCVKILDGHERGCNWVSFHPTQNMIASSSDDHKVKLWKYTNEVAWEHSSIPAHRNNVSCVIFEPRSGLLISNSEDRHLKMWNMELKTQVSDYRREDRYWIMDVTANGSLLVAGHDSGFELMELNRQIVPYALLEGDYLIYAKGMKTFINNLDPQKNAQKEELYQYQQKDPASQIFITRIIPNSFDRKTFFVQIEESGLKKHMLKRKETYLTYPLIVANSEVPLLDVCFASSDDHVALLSPHEIEINYSKWFNGSNKKKVIFGDDFAILRIFSFRLHQILLVTAKEAFYYNTHNLTIFGRLEVKPNADIRNVVCANGLIAIYGKNMIYILNDALELVTTIQEKYSIQSVFWNSAETLFFVTKVHLKFALLNGETGILGTLDSPYHILKKIDEFHFFTFSSSSSTVFTIDLPLDAQREMLFKLAVSKKQWDTVKKFATEEGTFKKRKSLINYLIKKGFAATALEMVSSLEEKFTLAIQATNFQLAFQVCSQINTMDYWRMLGEEALKQGIYEAFELSNQKQKNYNKLSFLYSLQSNVPKLEKMLKLANKMQNQILAFNTALFLDNRAEQEQILRDCGFESLAELAQETSKESVSDRLAKLGCCKLQTVKPEGEIDFSNWPHNLLEEEN